MLTMSPLPSLPSSFSRSRLSRHDAVVPGPESQRGPRGALEGGLRRGGRRPAGARGLRGERYVQKAREEERRKEGK